MSELVQRLRNCAQAYPEDIFPPLSKEDVTRLQSNNRHLLDRASAAMGRHFGPLFTAAADALEAKQAKIDALMLEYCPSEMTQEQRDEWAEHQRASESENCEHRD